MARTFDSHGRNISSRGDRASKAEVHFATSVGPAAGGQLSEDRRSQDLSDYRKNFQLVGAIALAFLFVIGGIVGWYVRDIVEAKKSERRSEIYTPNIPKEKLYALPK